MNRPMQMYPSVRQLRPYDQVEPSVRAELRAQAARARAERRSRGRLARLGSVTTLLRH
jgi:hypothetical protein